MLQHYGPVAGVVAGVTLLQLANTVFAVVLPLQIVAGGHPGTVAGVVASAYGAGFLAGCLFAHRLIRDVGHIRAFAALAAVCAILSLLFAGTRLVLLWFALRLVMGFCQAGLFTVVEGWLSAATPAHARGGVLAFYLVSTKVAIVGAQLALGRGGTASLGWFDLASGVFMAALIPVALTRTREPPPPRLELLGPCRLFRVAPAAVVGCAGSGLLNSAVLGLTPVFGAKLGLPVGAIVWLLTAIQLGSLALQWPLGRLSDRVDRRWIVAGCAGAVALLSLLIASAGARPWALFPLFFLWGGASLSFYAVCVAHAGDHAEPDQMVGVSSGSLLAWASGAAAGPTIAAPFLDLAGPAGLFVYASAIAADVSLFVLWRMGRRSPVPPEAREGRFVNLPATSLRLAEIDPRVPERPDGLGAELGNGQPPEGLAREIRHPRR
jgi:MFS family permease